MDCTFLVQNIEELSSKIGIKNEEVMKMAVVGGILLLLSDYSAEGLC